MSVTQPWTWTLLRAGAFRLDGGSMFGLIPRTIWERWSPPDGRNRISLHANCVLLRRGDEVVLIEAGFGDKWSDKERAIYDLERRTIVDALREQGVEPGAVSTIVLSHLHFDHAAGLTAEQEPGMPGSATALFPNARVVVQRREWVDACANRSTMTRTYLPTHLAPVEGQLRLVDGLTAVSDQLWVEPLPGHTWGMQLVGFRDGQGTIVFGGDIMPTTAHVHRSASMGYDMLPHEVMLQKGRFLRRAAEEGWRLVLSHEPDSPIQRVEPDGKDWFRFVAPEPVS